MNVLAGIGAGGTAIGLLAVVVLAFKLASAMRSLVAAADLLSEERKLSAQYKSERDTGAAKLKVTEDLCAQERTLRLVAVMQRDEAKRRLRDVLRKYVAHATDAEIQELTDDVFSSPLSVVPLSKQPGNELMEPDA